MALDQVLSDEAAALRDGAEVAFSHPSRAGWGLFTLFLPEVKRPPCWWVVATASRAFFAPLPNALLRQLVQVHLRVGVAGHADQRHGQFLPVVVLRTRAEPVGLFPGIGHAVSSFVLRAGLRGRC